MIYRTQKQWLALGELTWAHVFMTNGDLNRPGELDLPAGVVYSFDPWFERRPDRLEPIGQRLAYHRSQQPSPRRPWERLIFDQLYSGSIHTLHQELPPSLAGGRIVYHSTTIVHRSCLPRGYLTSTILPVLVQRQQSPRVCVPMPHAFWPQELLQRW
jgi:hypothetical protein